MKIVPLSKETLKQAIDLTLKSFLESKPEDFDYPEKWLKYSLEMKEKQENKYVSELGYWVAIDNKKVIGISGLYSLPDDKDANWLGWTCVDPEYRGKKIGGKLLDLMIEKARKNKKKFLRLYTDTRENERVARILYKKRGFVETKRKKDKVHGGDIIYMELKL